MASCLGCVPVVPERGARAVLVAVVLDAVLGAHVVEGPGDGGLAAVTEQVVGRGLSRERLVGRAAQQARARADGGQAVAAKARVARAVCVTPLPAGVLARPQVFDVTRRRQGRRDGVACSGNGHGNGRAGDGGAAVVRQRVAVGLIYADARGRRRGRHGGAGGRWSVARGPPRAGS